PNPNAIFLMKQPSGAKEEPKQKFTSASVVCKFLPDGPHTGRMAGGPQLASAGTVITEASLLSMKHLSSAPWAALILSLAFASFHPACLAEASSSSNSTLTVHHPGLETLEQCPNVDFCPQAARCCHTGVDEYGWIAAAVGWSLLFLTLILLCVDKLMKLTPDEPKDLQA
ncbi:transmembrane domain-containing protein, partial [Eschrichtius robustus]|nr:transmembrane domain-containing protein [Eschrichtius robustus]